MAEQILLLWHGEKATSEEKRLWELLKVSQSLEDIIFIEAESTEKWEHERHNCRKKVGNYNLLVVDHSQEAGPIRKYVDRTHLKLPLLHNTRPSNMQ